MSINDDILSRELKHRALLSLYEKKLDNDLTKVMSSHKKRLVASTLKNGNKSVNVLNRALTIETRKTYRKIYRDGITELKALANTSSKFHNNTLKESLGKVYRSKVYTGLKVNDLIINSAGTYSQQIASISLSQQRRIKDVVKKGMTENLAVNKIAKNVGDSIDLPSAQLKTLSRTAITETSSDISNATYKLNEDVLDGYQYVATLDSRTSLICGRLDGKVFRLDDKRGVRPPQHFNCGKRASFNGQVASETNFEQFLSRQDDSFKLAILGNKRRVEIYNTGKLKFTQFSTKTGQLVSVGRLEELLNGVKPVNEGLATTVSTTVNKKQAPLYGNTTSEELELLKDNYGNVEDEFTKGFRQLVPLKELRYGSGEYSKSRDRLTIGSRKNNLGDDVTKTINWKTTVTHELAHRYDDNIIDVVITKPDNFKKLSKGFVDVDIKEVSGRNFVRYRSKKYSQYTQFAKTPGTISELAIDSMIDDYNVLTYKLRNRTKNYIYESKKAIESTAYRLGSKEFNDHFKKLNNSKKSFLTDNEIREYIYHNRTTNYKGFFRDLNSSADITDADIYNFKLKLENKILDTSLFSRYDRDFRGEMNDYIGSISFNKIGAGHSDGYYKKFPVIGRTPSARILTEGNSSEAFAEYVALLRKYPDKKIQSINRKIAEHYAPDTTKTFDTLVKRLGEIYD
jgi:SPP1 gp7 family putative phage head morphogenesis protein